jgi:glycosyltransferase involved in cell wall biosynthesis
MVMTINPTAKAARRLVYLVTEDWYFLSHRLPMAKAAQQAGYDVHVLTNLTGHERAIAELGFEVHPVAWRRGSMNPLGLLSMVREIRRLYRALAPDLVHHVALQPTVVGSLAATGLPLVCLNAVTGWGFAFVSPKARARIARRALEWLLPRLLNRPRAAALVQNTDDRAALADLGVDADRIFLIPGSGVDVDLLQALPEPGGPITAGFVGRLLDSKGLRTLLAAHELLARRGRPVRLLIAGAPDPANPDSIPPVEIAAWKARSGVELLGHIADIRAVWAAAHIAVLPSRREGLPKSLLEAAACGRPIVATDVPGCRAIARAGVNALLTSADDAEALADAMDRLAQDAELRRRFGAASRRLAEDEFSSQRIGRETVALYDRLLGAPRGQRDPNDGLTGHRLLS